MKLPLFIGRNGPLITVLAVAAAALVAACAGNLPTAEMAVGRAAVERATEAAAAAPIEMAAAGDRRGPPHAADRICFTPSGSFPAAACRNTSST